METVFEFDKIAGMGYTKRFADTLRSVMKRGESVLKPMQAEAGAETVPEIDVVVAKPKHSAMAPWLVGGSTLAAGTALATALTPHNSGVEKLAGAAAEFEKMFASVPKGAKVKGEWTHIHPTTKVEAKGTFEGGYDNIPKGAKVKGEWEHEGANGTFNNENYKPKAGLASRAGHGVLGTAAVVGGAAAAGMGAAAATTPYQVNP